MDTSSLLVWLCLCQLPWPANAKSQGGIVSPVPVPYTVNVLLYAILLYHIAPEGVTPPSVEPPEFVVVAGPKVQADAPPDNTTNSINAISTVIILFFIFPTPALPFF